MTRSKIGHYKCLLKLSVGYDKEPFERNKQEKFDTEVNYSLYYTVYAKYLLEVLKYAITLIRSL
jgi:hypothetical protein